MASKPQGFSKKTTTVFNMNSHTLSRVAYSGKGPQHDQPKVQREEKLTIDILDESHEEFNYLSCGNQGLGTKKRTSIISAQANRQ